MLLHVQRGILPIFQKVIRHQTQSWVLETLTTMAIPLSFFLAFGLGLGGYISDVEGVPYIVFLAPGLITLTMMLEAYATGAWNLWLDRWYQKMIDEYRIKPVTTSDIVFGELIGGFVVAVAKGIIVTLVLVLLAPFSVKWQHLPAYLFIVFPGSILFTCIGTMVGTLCRKPDHIAQIQTIVITPLLYLGGLFFPISAFPQWVLPVVHWLPTTVLFDGGRRAMLYGEVDFPQVALLWVLSGISFWAATALFNRKLSE